jgi:hypothetical protein
MPATTGTVVNQANAKTLDLTISNDDTAATATVEVELFSVALSATPVPKIGAAHQLFNIPPLMVVTKTFNITGFPAYELQFNVTGDSNVVADTFALDAGGNLIAAERVLQSEDTIITSLTPLP